MLTRHLVALALILTGAACTHRPEPRGQAPRPSHAPPELAEELVAFVEGIGVIAQDQATDCDAFAAALNRYADDKAGALERMKAHQGQPPPQLSEAQRQRSTLAMERVSTIAQKCSGQPAFESAMGRVFTKRQAP